MVTRFGLSQSRRCHGCRDRYGAWSEPDVVAHLVWTACADPQIDHYALRACTGTRYNTSAESAVEEFPPTQTTFDTIYGLRAAGATIHFCVYVVLTTGNEKGSNKIIITRRCSREGESGRAG